MHALTTCCPQCAHCFVISIAQLQQRKGYVRCPQCASIFDGFEAVVDDSKPITLPPALPVGAGQPTSTLAGSLPTAPTPEPLSNYEATQAARLAEALYEPSEPADVASYEAEFQLSQSADLAAAPQENVEPNYALPQVFRERERFRQAHADRPQEKLTTDDESTFESYDASDVGYDPQPSATDQADAHLPKTLLLTEQDELNTRPNHDEDNRSMTHRENDDGPSAQEHTVSFGAQSLTSSSDFYIAPSSPHNPNHEQDFYVSGETPDTSFPRFSATGQDEPIAESEPVYDVGANEEEPEPESEFIGEHTLSGVYPDDEARHAARYATHSETSVWSRLFWRLCLWVLLLLLVAQAAYVYRHQLANQVPFLRPALEAVCQKLDCQISYERRAKFIDISDSELHAEPNAQKSGPYHYHLALNLHNRFKRAQAWPTLVIRLQDGRGQALSTIAVPPEQYLASKGLRSSFFAADSSQRVRLNLSTPERITHYELFSYFP